MMEKRLHNLQKQLSKRIKGDVTFDDVTRGIYATDASIYQITPVAVVLPKDRSDVIAVVEEAAEHQVSILPRGGGTSIGGQAVGSSIIIDFTKYMNRILDLDLDNRQVKVQPGIILDELNAALKKSGLHFAPDPATSNRATIGGTLGNNSSGTRSIIYGIARDHVVGMTVLLSDGTLLNLGERSPEEYHRIMTTGDPRTAEIYSGFETIIHRNREEIRRRFPKIMRRVQGYNLDSFVDADSWNLSHLIVGSEGTLGVILDTTLNLEPLPKNKILCIAHFDDLLGAIRAVGPILKHHPSAVEILDADVISLARENISIRPLTGFIQGNPAAILIVEFFAESPREAQQKAEELAADMENKKLGYSWPIIPEPAEQAKVWNVRKNGLGIMLGMKGERKPMAFIEDACIPISVLPEYTEQILSFCRERNVPVLTYAHASVGTLHTRPMLNLKVQEDIDNMKAIAEYAFGLVIKYGGSWSSEHGDGRNRSPFLERYFGAELYNALRAVKELFDPAGLMNPGIIIDPHPMDHDLRYGTTYRPQPVRTEYHYREDGSFAAAVEMCSGVGTCRQRIDGTMCPSYRATLDEEHSTRGRANALRLAMTGQLGPDGLSMKRLYGVMDLCLSCKSCKSECPSNVDLARLKGEFLQHYRDVHGTGLRERMVAWTPAMAKLIAGPLAPLANFIQRTGMVRWLLEMFVGFDRRRTLPAYASVPLQKWFSGRSITKGGAQETGEQRVVLFDDTYMSYHETRIGISAVELLESCGYNVILAEAGCCQRPRISHGFLREAKRAGEKTLRNLDRYIQQGLTIVVCEPGCCSALTDDLPDLIDDEELGNRIKENVMMIDQFIAREVASGALTCSFTSPYRGILIHGHCHQKSLYGTSGMTGLLRRVPGVTVNEIESGCCGMAGSFGYEKEHYELSMRIGNMQLFPAIRNRSEGTAVVACGFSCRHQIMDGTGIQPLHWVEMIRGVSEKSV